MKTHPTEALVDAPPELIARLAARAPQTAAPSRAVLAAALARIEAQRPPTRRMRRALTVWSGWAAAAAMAVLAWWQPMTRDGKASGGLWSWWRGDAPAENGEASSDSQASDLAKSGPDQHGDEPLGQRNPRNQRRVGTLPSTTGSFTAIQDFPRLQRELQQLRASEQARFQATPGLSRTVVVEMIDPSRSEEAERAGRLHLSERVAESIAAGVSEKPVEAPPDEEKPAPPAPVPQPLHLSGGDGSWNGDVVIEKGLPNTGMLNLPEGTQIKHLDFPVENAATYRGLLDLGSGWFYDQFSDVLWQPTGEGRVYLGQKPPLGFDAETFAPPTAAPEAIAQTEPVPTGEIPSPENPPMHETGAPSGESDGLAATPPTRGYPIYDETTGSGSIILQNLPPAAEGQIYQLWLTDAATQTPVNVGYLPSLPEGSGRIWFDLGGPGLAPSGYQLRLAPLGEAGAVTPGGRVVLQGP